MKHIFSMLIASSFILPLSINSALAERDWEPPKTYEYINPTITKVQIGEKYISNIVIEKQPYQENVAYVCPVTQHVPAKYHCSKEQNRFADFTSECNFVAAHNVTVNNICFRNETKYKDVSVDRSYMEPIYEDKYTCSRGKLVTLYYTSTKTSAKKCQINTGNAGGPCRDSGCSDGAGSGK